MSRKSRAKPPNPFKCFNSSPEVIRLVVMMYVRFPLSLRNVEDLLFERGIDLYHEPVRMWWNQFGPMFVGYIRMQRVSRMTEEQKCNSDPETKAAASTNHPNLVVPDRPVWGWKADIH